jgi:hypothetical protein
MFAIPSAVKLSMRLAFLAVALAPALQAQQTPSIDSNLAGFDAGLRHPAAGQMVGEFPD